jgi:hypothetical protein
MFGANISRSTYPIFNNGRVRESGGQRLRHKPPGRIRGTASGEAHNQANWPVRCPFRRLGTGATGHQRGSGQGRKKLSTLHPHVFLRYALLRLIGREGYGRLRVLTIFISERRHAR